jgi:hypothetical protein
MCEKCKDSLSHGCNSPGECDCPKCQGLCVDFDYDPELSDSDENGEQHYTKRTNLRK